MDDIKYQTKFKFEHKPVHVDNEDVIATYGEWKTRWPSIPTLGKDPKADTERGALDPLVNLLGDCFLPSFSRTHVEHIDVTPYNFKARNRLAVNVAIADRVRWVLSEIAAWGQYEIRALGGYHLRYKNNNSTHSQILADKAYCQAARDWYKNKYPTIAGHHVEPDTDWMQYCLLYDIHERPEKVRWGLVSNHSFGTAIDINPDENGLNADTWDMPVKIVELFREAGFGWGGLYKTGKDAMHFEYAFPFVSPRAPRPQFLCREHQEEPLLHPPHRA